MSAHESIDQRNQNENERRLDLPVQRIDKSIFDHNFTTLKELFANEMKKIDEQMNKFSKDLMRFYGQNRSIESGQVPSRQENPVATWNVLTSSPLVQGDGDEKTMKLQFDVSQFDPAEVQVKLQNDTLIVSASHKENAEGIMSYREYYREFSLPPDTDPSMVVSSVSRDGVLLVEVPLPLLTDGNTWKAIQD